MLGSKIWDMVVGTEVVLLLVLGALQLEVVVEERPCSIEEHKMLGSLASSSVVVEASSWVVVVQQAFRSILVVVDIELGMHIVVQVEVLDEGLRTNVNRLVDMMVVEVLIILVLLVVQVVLLVPYSLGSQVVQMAQVVLACLDLQEDLVDRAYQVGLALLVQLLHNILVNMLGHTRKDMPCHMGLHFFSGFALDNHDNILLCASNLFLLYSCDDVLPRQLSTVPRRQIIS